jgi:hypothetical protein
MDKNSATKLHLMMTEYGSKHVVININVNNLCYYFYLNCSVDGYKYVYTALKDAQKDATRKANAGTVS